MNQGRSTIESVRSGPGDGRQPPHHGPRAIHTHITRPVIQQLVDASAQSVLDLGCGNGWFAGALDSCGFDVTGLDSNEVVLRHARQHHPTLNLRQMDVMDPLDAGLTMCFDAVVAIDLLDHVQRPRRMVETALAALKPGGLLVFTLPFHGYLKNLALAVGGRFDSRWDPLLDHGRTKYFSRATLTALLNEFDLRELHFETIGRIPTFARSMLISAKTPSP